MSIRLKITVFVLLGTLIEAMLPVAVLVHSVLAWVFSVTVQPMGHSTIFGPAFP